MRLVLLVLMLLALLSGCFGDDKPVVTTNDAMSQTILLKDCNSPTWKQQNLGLWYSVCRPPMKW